MKAMVLGETGPQLAEVTRPAPQPHEVLVRVQAAALNRVDLAMAAGHVHGGAGGLGQVLGLEWAGEVVEVGADVRAWRPGDRVMCSGRGGFAEYAVCDWGRVLPAPRALAAEEAAALPVSLQTLHDALITQGEMALGDAVLIQGASSGVGLMGLQIARRLGAACVIGSSTHAARRARLADFGAHLAIDSCDAAWVQQVLDATEGRGVNVLVDMLAGPLMNDNLRATALGGRIVNVGRLAGMRGEFDFDLHALRRIRYVGVTFRTRSLQDVRDVTTRLLADLREPLARGELRLPVDRVFALDQLSEALAHMRSNAHFGKLVLRV
jgi:NADPH2:quinone reductase